MQRIFTAIGLDFETGGLDCNRHACTQIALQAVRLDTLDVMDRYASYIAPYDKQEIFTQSKRKVLKSKWELSLDFGREQMEYEQKALEYAGITLEMLAKRGAELKEVARNIIDFAVRNTLSPHAKPVLIGHNIPFDIGFLQQLMNYAGLVKDFEKAFAGSQDFYGHFQPHYIDTLQLAHLAFAGDDSVSSYKLELMTARLGIGLDDAHDAGSDISAAMDMFRIFSGRMRDRKDGDKTAVREKETTRDWFKI